MFGVRPMWRIKKSALVPEEPVPIKLSPCAGHTRWLATVGHENEWEKHDPLVNLDGQIIKIGQFGQILARESCII